MKPSRNQVASTSTKRVGDGADGKRGQPLQQFFCNWPVPYNPLTSVPRPSVQLVTVETKGVFGCETHGSSSSSSSSSPIVLQITPATPKTGEITPLVAAHYPMGGRCVSLGGKLSQLGGGVLRSTSPNFGAKFGEATICVRTGLTSHCTHLCTIQVQLGW